MTLNVETNSQPGLDPSCILTMTRHFDASPERVFDAWTKPEMVSRWLFASPTDEAYHAEIDARVGGTYTITARREGTDYTATGEYLEVDRPRRLVFTFAMPQFSPDSDRLIVEFALDGAGCLMTFIQEGLSWTPENALEYKTGSEQGWSLMFDYGLAAALG